MVATSVTVTTIICYQPASQASLISNLAHNDPGKLVITPSMQLSGGEPRPLSVSFYFVPQEKNITVKLARLGEPIFWSQWSWQGGVSSRNGGRAMVGVAVQVISIGTTALHRWSSWLWWQSLYRGWFFTLPLRFQNQRRNCCSASKSLFQIKNFMHL